MVTGSARFARPDAIRRALLGVVAARALGCSRREGRSVIRSMYAANRRFQQDYRRLAMARRPRLPDIYWPGEQSFRDAVARDGRPMVLATLHLGNYASALLGLAPRLAWLRRVTVLRRPRVNALEQPLLAQAAAHGLAVTVARAGEHPARAALRALRRGDHVLLLYDVPPAFDIGRTFDVPFLGAPAAFPAGPAMLARAGNALLWPFACNDSHRGLTLTGLDPLTISTVADLYPATARLARFAERRILEAPGEWLLWAHLPAIWAAAGASEQRV